MGSRLRTLGCGVTALTLLVFGVASANTYTPAADTELFMRVGKELRLGKNAIFVRLTCPRSEANGPCRGKALMADPPLIFNGPHTLQARPLHGRFEIQQGETRAIPLRRPYGRTSRLPEEPGTWRVYLLVTAVDEAGNKWDFRKRRALLIRR